MVNVNFVIFLLFSGVITQIHTLKEVKDGKFYAIRDGQQPVHFQRRFQESLGTKE